MKKIKKIRVLVGSFVNSGVHYTPGKTYEIAEDFFDWLVGMQSATLQLKEVAASATEPIPETPPFGGASVFISLTSVDDVLARKLEDAGIGTIQGLKKASDEFLLKIKGIGPKRLAQIRKDLEG